MASYHKKTDDKEKHPGHNHPIKEKCDERCPRNKNYKGPVRKFDFFRRKG